MTLGDFTVFGKSPYDDWLLWDDFVRPQLQDDLLSETWGRPFSDDICDSSDYKVSNINDLKYNDDYVWRHTQDHSKWGLTNNKNYMCVSDMNRMDSQASRGGSAFCIEDDGLRNAFKSMVIDDGCALVAPVP